VIRDRKGNGGVPGGDRRSTSELRSIGEERQLGDRRGKSDFFPFSRFIGDRHGRTESSTDRPRLGVESADSAESGKTRPSRGRSDSELRPIRAPLG